MIVMSEQERPSIPEFFSGKNVFITGASGFMGKVLIEKLLRSCPELGNVYILLRHKKGKTPKERVQQFVDVPLFDSLKEANKNAINKIIPLAGDVTKLCLGLSEEHQELIKNKVNLIFHCAASVRFDERLKDAVLLNTRGTRELVNLAKQIKNLFVLLHVSTTYCNTDRKVIEEEICPPHADWRNTIELAEKYDSHALDVLCTKYMGELPNTYTFSKSLAEHVINDLCNDQLPAVICRPSIVISTLKDPVPGWIDNFNGPVGLLVASGKGVVRSMYADPDIKPDYVPVDLVIKAMILAAWDKGLQKEDERLKLNIYNCSNNSTRDFTAGDIEKVGPKLLGEVPLEQILWYPATETITTSFYLHYIRMIFYHLLPALFVDGILKLTNNKPMLIKVHRRIFIANMALRYFITQEWTFKNEKVLALESRLLERDRTDFGYDHYSPLTEPVVFFKSALLGAKKYLLKEKSSVEDCKRNLTRMWILAVIFNILYYTFVFWLLFYKLDIVSIIAAGLQNLYIYFSAY